MKASTFFTIIKDSVSKFIADDLMTHAAALAYYTIFSLPPMLLVILFTTTQFYDKAAVNDAIFGEIESMIGQSSAEQLSSTIERIGIFDVSSWTAILGIGALLFTATTVFVTIQNTLNIIFRVKPKPKGNGFLKMIKDRVLSFSFLIGLSFVLLVSLVVSAVIRVFSEQLENYIGNLSTLLAMFFAIVLPIVITTFLFAMLFKYLPDAKLKWRDTWIGALFTALLFGLGKYLIGFYIGNSETANLYDAAGGVMVIMVWVFFASSIFLFGAVFTAVQARNRHNGNAIPPNKYAVKVIEKEVTLEELNKQLQVEE